MRLLNIAVLISIFLCSAEINNSESLTDVWFCKFEDQMRNQSDAATLCVTNGGQLAKVYNPLEDAAIKALNLTTNYWFGLNVNLSAHTYSFSDGISPKNESKLWTSSQPDWSGSCVQYWQAGGSRWDDTSCTQQKGTLCEFYTEKLGCSHVTRAETEVVTGQNYFCVFPRARLRGIKETDAFCQSKGGNPIRLHNQKDVTQVAKSGNFMNVYIDLKRNSQNKWVYSDGSSPDTDLFWFLTRDLPSELNCVFIGIWNNNFSSAPKQCENEASSEDTVCQMKKPC